MRKTMKKNAAALLTIFALLTMQAVIAFGADAKAGGSKTEASPSKPEAVKSPTDVLAKVNGTAITRREAERATQIFLAQNRAPQNLSPEVMKQAEEAALNQLIDAELLYQTGAKREIKDLDKQVAEKVKSGKERFATAAEFEAALKSNNISEKELEGLVRRDVVISNLLEQDVISKITVPEADIRKFYDQNADKFKMPESYHASHILIGVEPQAKPEEKKKAREKAESIRKKILAGEDFATLAKAESSCPSKEKGGDLGTFGKGEMVPEFEKATEALKPGEISDVVETQFGYHIIKLIEKKPGGEVKFDEVKTRIRDYLKQNNTQKAIQDYITGLKTKATIERFPL